MRKAFVFLSAGVAVVLTPLILVTLWFYLYLSWHGEGAATRRAVAAEARTLMAQAPSPDFTSQRHSAQLPKAIAALKPFDISVRKDGAYITMRVLFDDGCGYFVPRDQAHFIAPSGNHTSYTPLGEGVWWFHST